MLIAPVDHPLLKKGGVSKQRVKRLMKHHGIRAKGKRRSKVTKDSNHHLSKALNMLERQLTVATSRSKCRAFYAIKASANELKLKNDCPLSAIGLISLEFRFGHLAGRHDLLL